MKRLALGFLGSITAATAFLAVHCGSGEQHPPPGNVDALREAGTDTGGGGTTDAGGGGAIEISPAELFLGDKGMVNCGTQAPAQTITYDNRSSKTQLFKAAFQSGGDYYTLSPAEVSVSAGASSAVQVVPKALPSTSGVTPELYSGNVIVTTFDSGSTTANGSTTIRIHQTARGAIIQSTVGGKDIQFGGVKIGTSSAQTFSVTNTGNVAADLSFSVGSAAFTVTPSAKLDPNGTKVQTVTFGPTAAQSYTDTLVTTIAPGTPICNSIPDKSNLSGSGTTAIGVAPGNLAFGLVNCGTTAAFKTVTISNSGGAMTFTPTLGKGAGSYYTLADSTGTPVTLGAATPVGAATDYVLRVVPKQVTAPVTTAVDGLSDMLTITTDSPGDSPHFVQLTETAQGAYISLNAASYKITDGAPSHSILTNVIVSNTGNLPGNYTIAVAGRSGVPAGTFTLNSGGGSLAIGAGQTVVLTTRTDSGWQCVTAPKSQYLGDITLTPSATALCADAQPIAPVSLECP